MADIAALPTLVADNWEWQLRGACRGLSGELFFNPDNERGRLKRTREAKAKAICATCPVTRQCLNWALSIAEPYGVWGGTTPADRDDIRAGRPHLALAN